MFFRTLSYSYVIAQLPVSHRNSKMVISNNTWQWHSRLLKKKKRCCFRAALLSFGLAFDWRNEITGITLTWKRSEIDYKSWLCSTLRVWSMEQTYIITPVCSFKRLEGATTLKSSWKVCSNGSFRGARNPLAWRERVNADLDFAATVSGRWHHRCNYSSDPPLRLLTWCGICVYVYLSVRLRGNGFWVFKAKKAKSRKSLGFISIGAPEMMALLCICVLRNHDPKAMSFRDWLYPSAVTMWNKQQD